MSCVAALGEVAEFVNGVAFKPSDWTGVGRKIVRIQNLNDKTKPYNRTERVVDRKYEINKGDILVSWSASLGVFTWEDEEQALLNQHIFKVVPDEDIVCRKYLLHALHKALDDMGQHLHGATMKHVNRGEFLSTQIYLPPLKEQKRIAAILDKADAIRRKRQQAIDLTDQLLRSVFLDMFGDPVTNPKGYKLGKIEDLLSSVNYGTSAKAGEVGAYPILRMNNITYEGGWNFDSLKYIDMNEKDLKKYTAESGDILFNRTNSKKLVGKTAVFREAEPYVFAGYLVRSKVNSLAVPEYISSFLNSVYGKRVLQIMCKSIVGMANINAKEYQSIKILIPPIAEQMKYADIVNKCNDDLITYKKSLGKCEELFLSLVQQAFNGKLSKQSKAA